MIIDCECFLSIYLNVLAVGFTVIEGSVAVTIIGGGDFDRVVRNDSRSSHAPSPRTERAEFPGENKTHYLKKPS